MLFLGGLGLAAYYGDEWQRLPKYSDEQIELSVERNLQIDIARMGALKPGPEELARLRAIVRAEVEGDIGREARKSQQGIALGLIAMVFGLGQMVYLRLSTPKGA
jgi:hypothetical protein